MKNLLLLSIMFCISTILYAQDNYKQGYIITNQNDTVIGWINLRTNKNNQKQCEFKPDLKLATKIYLPGDIAGYRFIDEGKYYVSRDIQLNGNSRKVFLEFLVKGIMNLYYYEDAIDYYFFENQDGKMEIISQQPERIEDTRVVKDNKYVGQIRYLFKDYQPIAQKADKLKFDQKSMMSVVEEYHNEVCTTGESCIVFQNEHPDDKGLISKISVYTGFQISNYKFYTTNFGKGSFITGNNLSPVLGVQLNILNPRWWPKPFSIQLDVAFSKFQSGIPNGVMRYVRDVTDEIRPYTDASGKVTSYKVLASSFRLGVKYTYPKYKIAPTMEAGVDYTKLGGVLVKYGMLRSYLFGYYIAVGADYKIKISHAIFIRLVYENYSNSDGLQYYGNDKINMPQMKIGYTF